MEQAHKLCPERRGTAMRRPQEASSAGATEPAAAPTAVGPAERGAGAAAPTRPVLQSLADGKENVAPSPPAAAARCAKVGALPKRVSLARQRARAARAGRLEYVLDVPRPDSMLWEGCVLMVVVRQLCDWPD